MDKNTDLRITRTRKMINTAFYELMSTIGFERITVQNLTKKAMISRTTFYLHYKDKFDLLDCLENEILDGLKCISEDLSPDLILKELTQLDDKPFSLIVKIYEYVKENEQFFSLIMGPHGDPAFLSKLNQTLKSASTRIINFDRLKIPEHYALAFLIGVQTSFINEWLNSGSKESPYEIATIITQIIGDIPKKMYL